jgi:hypothetical protein
VNNTLKKDPRGARPLDVSDGEERMMRGSKKWDLLLEESLASLPVLM